MTSRKSIDLVGVIWRDIVQLRDESMTAWRLAAPLGRGGVETSSNGVNVFSRREMQRSTIPLVMLAR